MDMEEWRYGSVAGLFPGPAATPLARLIGTSSRCSTLTHGAWQYGLRMYVWMQCLSAYTRPIMGRLIKRNGGGTSRPKYSDGDHNEIWLLWATSMSDSVSKLEAVWVTSSSLPQ